MKNIKSFKVRRLFNFCVFTLLLTFFVTVSTSQKVNAATDNQQKIISALNNKNDKLHPTNSIKIDKNVIDSIEYLTELEQKAFDILNEIRESKGLTKLAWSENMAKIARLHSGNMAKHKFFSHNGIDGLMVNDRADALGIYDWSAIGENIAFIRGYERPAEFACQNWMKSPSHHDNILNGRWRESAIGVAKALDGTLYFTQVFFTK